MRRHRPSGNGPRRASLWSYAGPRGGGVQAEGRWAGVLPAGVKQASSCSRRWTSSRTRSGRADHHDRRAKSADGPVDVRLIALGVPAARLATSSFRGRRARGGGVRRAAPRAQLVIRGPVPSGADLAPGVAQPPEPPTLSTFRPKSEAVCSVGALVTAPWPREDGAASGPRRVSASEALAATSI